MMRFSLSQALIITLAIQVTGCALTQKSESEEVVIEGPVYYTVEQDDRLSDIAYALTGSIDNWVVIAEYNDVKDARKIRTGDVLEIPVDLIHASRSNQQSDSGVLAISTVGSNQALSTNSGRLVKSIASIKKRLTKPPNTPDKLSNVDGDVEVVLRPVDINRKFQLNETNIDFVPDSAAVETNAKIRIVGTYFPKGIYAQPLESAKLISRVAPGVIFDLDASLDGWFRLRFEGGHAYLREIDGKIFFPNKPEILRSAEANE